MDADWMRLIEARLEGQDERLSDLAKESKRQAAMINWALGAGAMIGGAITVFIDKIRALVWP